MRRRERPPYPQIRTRKDQLKTEITEATHLMYTFVKGVAVMAQRTLVTDDSKMGGEPASVIPHCKIKSTCGAGEIQLFLELGSERTLSQGL